MLDDTDNPLDTAVADPATASIDRALKAAPNTLTEEDIAALVPALREHRARFIQAEQRKVDKAAGIADLSPDLPWGDEDADPATATEA